MLLSVMLPRREVTLCLLVFALTFPGRNRFSDHPAYLAAYRAAIAKVAAVRCEILLTPHPSASAMRSRMLGEQPLFDEAGCRNYSAELTKRLDERLAKEQAAQK